MITHFDKNDILTVAGKMLEAVSFELQNKNTKHIVYVFLIWYIPSFPWTANVL